MTSKRLGQSRKVIGAALFVTACSPAEKPCETPPVNDAGMRCACVDRLGANDQIQKTLYCDPDIGNPCMIGCFNPKEADGGRQYMGGEPVCFC